MNLHIKKYLQSSMFDDKIFFCRFKEIVKKKLSNWFTK